MSIVWALFARYSHPHPTPLPCLRRSGFAQAGIKGEGEVGAKYDLTKID
jgi:hypothetical protein